mmetsp:Transcript_26555/g.88935  ORF Transcript_26555/g.88935 Transcript_26555/m.88935 type:complete len:264 (-) Transcript_26555:640-1431(-)
MKYRTQHHSAPAGAAEAARIFTRLRRAVAEMVYALLDDNACRGSLYLGGATVVAAEASRSVHRPSTSAGNVKGSTATSVPSSSSAVSGAASLEGRAESTTLITTRTPRIDAAAGRTRASRAAAVRATPCVMGAAPWPSKGVSPSMGGMSSEASPAGRGSHSSTATFAMLSNSLASTTTRGLLSDSSGRGRCVTLFGKPWRLSSSSLNPNASLDGLRGESASRPASHVEAPLPAGRGVVLSGSSSRRWSAGKAWGPKHARVARR